jgi:hypothetical protein
MTALTRGIAIRLVVALLLCGLAAATPMPALAEGADVGVSVAIPQAVELDYTGSDVIEFVLTLRDLAAGSKGQMNQGDLLWWSNTAPWYITIERTEWDSEDGDPDLELWLQVKCGPPHNTPWVTVPVETDPDAPAVWLEGDSTGSGTYEGVDWKVKDLTKDMQPGTYWCTVTISIVAGEPP